MSRKFHHPNDPMWVVGCIDHLGAISARVVQPPHGDCLHRPEESRGKRWRWNIWGQEFHSTRNPSLDRLSLEECFAVEDWLFRHGHKYEEPEPIDDRYRR